MARRLIWQGPRLVQALRLPYLLLGLGVALGVASATVLTEDMTWARQGAPARAAVDMTTILVAALAAILLRARSRDDGGGRDLMLALGVGLFGVAEATCSLLPEIVSQVNDRMMSGVEATASLLVACVVAVAALAPSSLIGRAGQRTSWTMAGALIVLPLGALMVAERYPVDSVSASPQAWEGPVYLAAAALALIAGCAFVARAARHGGEQHSWVAAAIVLLGAANLDSALSSVLTEDSLTTGDLLHVGVVVILLAGVVRELGSRLTSATRRGIAGERRRIARELHDGLAQELAYIAAQAPRFAAESNDPVAARLAEAAACALDESRLAISSLGGQPSEPLGLALTRTAERIAARSGAVVRSDIGEGIEVAPDVRIDLLRIVREATTNAVHHGGATEVSIVLRGEPRLMLQIADNGSGFELGRGIPGTSSGFGLTSMRERAERAGGRLRVRSGPGRGTIVEVCFT